CVAAVPLGPPPAKCVNGGPPINIGNGTNPATCTGNIAQTTFTWALCSCTNITLQDLLITDAFDSTKGPYPQPNVLGGSVGLDNVFNASNTFTVGGTLWGSASTGLSSSANGTVKEELHSGGPVNFDALDVGLDGFVNGNVNT